jgi:ArsR family transcriptional regulator
MRRKNNKLITDKDKGLPMESFASMCKALGHPARVLIITYLQRIDRCLCGDIVELLPLAQSTVSQHLKCLKDAGLIKGEVEGPKTCYCINKVKLAEFSRMAVDLDVSSKS